MLFPNGNTAAFKNGEQVPELQKSWLIMYLQFLELNEIDPTKCQIEIGSRIVRPFKTEDGFWNWEIR